MLIILAALKTCRRKMVEATHVDGGQPMADVPLSPADTSVTRCSSPAWFRLIDSIKAFPLIYILNEGAVRATSRKVTNYTLPSAFGFATIGYSSDITRSCSVCCNRAERRKSS